MHVCLPINSRTRYIPVHPNDTMCCVLYIPADRRPARLQPLRHPLARRGSSPAPRGRSLWTAGTAPSTTRSSTLLSALKIQTKRPKSAGGYGGFGRYIRTVLFRQLYKPRGVQGLCFLSPRYACFFVGREGGGGPASVGTIIVVFCETALDKENILTTDSLA